jgi:hypothetical protein
LKWFSIKGPILERLRGTFEHFDWNACHSRSILSFYDAEIFKILEPTFAKPGETAFVDKHEVVVEVELNILQPITVTNIRVGVLSSSLPFLNQDFHNGYASSKASSDYSIPDIHLELCGHGENPGLIYVHGEFLPEMEVGQRLHIEFEYDPPPGAEPTGRNQPPPEAVFQLSEVEIPHYICITQMWHTKSRPPRSSAQGQEFLISRLKTSLTVVEHKDGERVLVLAAEQSPPMLSVVGFLKRLGLVLMSSKLDTTCYNPSADRFRESRQ